MLIKKVIIGSFISWGLLISGGELVAQNTHEMPHSENSQTTEFQRLEQPLWIKATVTAGGLGLIGLNLWWFLLSKPKSQKVASNNGIQEVTIRVDGGYEPSRVVVNSGQKVRLNFLRSDPSSCLEQVVFPDFHIAQDLQLNQTTPIEFTPEKPGEYTFACGMNMFRGVVEAR
jgi:plastocyanin domain-containing protein